MKKYIGILSISLIIAFAPVAAYYFYLGKFQELSSNTKDWSEFGGYVGGTTGVLLSLISMAFLALTIYQQNIQLKNAFDESNKRDMLLNVNRADEEINHWLQRRLAAVHTSGQTIEFGDVVWGLIPIKYISESEFKTATNRLVELTCAYCGALALYKDNVDTNFVYSAHKRKAEALINFLKRNNKILEPMCAPSLDICQSQI